jgi:hypothetical protein
MLVDSDRAMALLDEVSDYAVEDFLISHEISP